MYYYKCIETGKKDKVFRTKKEALKWFDSLPIESYYENPTLPHVLKDGTFMSTKGLVLTAVYKLKFD